MPAEARRRGKFSLGRNILAALFVCLAVATSPAQAQERSAPSGAASTPGVVEFRADLPPGTILARPDSDRVRLSDGRLLPVRDVRRLHAVAQRLRSGAKKNLPPALTRRPAAQGVVVRDSSELAAALERGDEETIQLPSGRRLTVGMLRLLQPEIEQRLGRPLSESRGRAAPSGKAVRVGASTDWREIFDLPDGTVLEAPDGTRITLAELKQALADAPVRPEGPDPAESR